MIHIDSDYHAHITTILDNLGDNAPKIIFADRLMDRDAPQEVVDFVLEQVNRKGHKYDPKIPLNGVDTRTNLERIVWWPDPKGRLGMLHPTGSRSFLPSSLYNYTFHMQRTCVLTDGYQITLPNKILFTEAMRFDSVLSAYTYMYYGVIIWATKGY